MHLPYLSVYCFRLTPQNAEGSFQDKDFLSKTTRIIALVAIDIFLASREFFLMMRAICVAHANTVVYIASFRKVSFDDWVERDASWLSVAAHVNSVVISIKTFIGLHPRNREAEILLIKLYELVGVKIQLELSLRDKVFMMLGKASNEMGRRLVMQQNCLLWSIASIALVGTISYYAWAFSESLLRVSAFQEKNGRVDNGDSPGEDRTIFPKTQRNIQRISHSLADAAYPSYRQGKFSFIDWMNHVSDLFPLSTKFSILSLTALGTFLTFWTHSKSKKRLGKMEERRALSVNHLKGKTFEGIDSQIKVLFSWKDVNWEGRELDAEFFERIIAQIAKDEGFNPDYLNTIARIPQDPKVYRLLIQQAIASFEKRLPNQKMLDEKALLFGYMVIFLWWRHCNSKIKQWKEIQWSNPRWLRNHFSSLLSLLADNGFFTKDVRDAHKFKTSIPQESYKHLIDAAMNDLDERQEWFGYCEKIKSLHQDRLPNNQNKDLKKSLESLSLCIASPIKEEIYLTIAFGDALGGNWPFNRLIEDCSELIKGIKLKKDGYIEEKASHLVLLAALRSAKYRFKDFLRASSHMKLLYQHVLTNLLPFSTVKIANEEDLLDDLFMIPILFKIADCAMGIEDRSVKTHILSEYVMSLIPFRRGSLEHESGDPYIRFLVQLADVKDKDPICREIYLQHLKTLLQDSHGDYSLLIKAFEKKMLACILKSKGNLASIRHAFIEAIQWQREGEKSRGGEDPLKSWTVDQCLQRAGLALKADKGLAKAMLIEVINNFKQRLLTLHLPKKQESKNFQHVWMIDQLLSIFECKLKQTKSLSEILQIRDWLQRIHSTTKIEKDVPTPSQAKKLKALEEKLGKIHQVASKVTKSPIQLMKVRDFEDKSQDIQQSLSKDYERHLSKLKGIRQILTDSQKAVQPKKKWQLLKECQNILKHLLLLKDTQQFQQEVELFSLIKAMEEATRPPLTNDSAVFKNLSYRPLVKKLFNLTKGAIDINEPIKGCTQEIAENLLNITIEANGLISLDLIACFKEMGWLTLADKAFQRVSDLAKQKKNSRLQEVVLREIQANHQSSFQ